MIKNLYSQAVSLARAGRKEEARAIFQQVIELNPLNESAWLWYADTLPTTQERIQVLEECLQVIPQSKAARNGLELLRQQNQNRNTVQREDDFNGFDSGPFSSSMTGQSEPLVQVNPFQPGSSDMQGGSVFTISPDEVTNEDLADAERNLMEDIRLDLTDLQRGNNTPTQPFVDTKPNTPVRRPGARAAAEESLDGNSRSASSSEKPVYDQPGVTREEKKPWTWQPTFSDEEKHPEEERQSGVTFDQSLFGEVAEPSTDRIEYIPAGPFAGSESTGAANNQPDVSEIVAGPSNPPAKKMRETRHKDIIFYLIVGSVIVLILLIVLVVMIFNPGALPGIFS